MKKDNVANPRCTCEDVRMRARHSKVPLEQQQLCMANSFKV